MPTVLIPPKTPFTTKGSAFRKEVLRAGYYQHPVDPWDEPLDLSNKDIEDLAAASNAAIDAGIRVWVPLTHTTDPAQNRGYVKRFETAESTREPGRMSLYAITDIRNPETADQIRRGEIEDVSVGLEDYGDHRGNKFGLRIGHVALVADPVFAGQDSFVALSRHRGSGKSPDVTVLEYRSAEAMKKSLSTRLRGISAPLPAAPVVRKRLSVTGIVRKAAKALGITLEGKRVTQEDFEAICEAATAKATEGVVLGEPTAVKALSRTADATFTELHTERSASLAATVKGHIKAGRLPAAVENDVVALLSVRHGYSLSAKGEATAVDVRATLERVIAAIPDAACVPLTERIKQLSVAPGQPPVGTEGFDAKKEIEERTKRLSARK